MNILSTALGFLGGGALGAAAVQPGAGGSILGGLLGGALDGGGGSLVGSLESTLLGAGGSIAGLLA